jgi:hypothetical protein
MAAWMFATLSPTTGEIFVRTGTVVADGNGAVPPL